MTETTAQAELRERLIEAAGFTERPDLGPDAGGKWYEGPNGNGYKGLPFDLDALMGMVRVDRARRIDRVALWVQDQDGLVLQIQPLLDQLREARGDD